VASDGNQVSLITDQMRKDLRLGEVAGTFTYEVDRKWVRQFAAAFDDPNPLWHDEAYARDAGRFGTVIAPPTFFAALDPVETRELLLDPWVETIPYKNTGGGNAFNEVEYFLPIRAGDTISVEVTYTDIFERDGRSGRLLFRIRENVLKNQRGELVARARSGHVRSYDLSKKRDG
jgi:acyl dehydratase